MSKIIKWLSANKVLLAGLLSAVLMDVQTFTSDSTDWKVVGLSIGIVITSYLAKNLRGQWITVLGSLGSSLSIILTSIQNHFPISWQQIITTFLVNILAVVAPAGKSLAYEQSPTIEAAKAQGSQIDASKNPPLSPPVQTNTPVK